MNTSKLNCNEVQSMLDAYHDNELDDKSVQIVKAHLLKCSDCVEVLAQIRETVLLLQKLPRISLRQDIIGEINKSRQSQKRHLYLTGAIGVAAAIACLVILGKHPQLGMPETKGANPKFELSQTLAAQSIMAQSTGQKSMHLIPLKTARVKRKILRTSDIYIANIWGSDQNCISETLGCTTDEDGLYAFKM